MAMYEEYKIIEPDFNHDHHHHHEQFIVSYTGNIVKLPCVGSTGDSLVYRLYIVMRWFKHHQIKSQKHLMHDGVSWVKIKSYGL